MKRIAGLSITALLLAACSSDSSPVSPDAAFGRLGDPELSVGSGAIAIVTHAYDSGKGSFRDAVAQANSDARIRRIEFKPEARTILLQSSIEYTGTQALSIIGKDATLDARDANGAAFLSTGGADLTIEALTVRNAIAEGIDIEVPTTATGTITVTLDRVTAIDNAGHGVLVNDQEESTTEDGVQPNANGSAASVVVTVIGSRFVNNGYSVSDRDGLRVNEGGEGSLTFTARDVASTDNAADGIELDERGVGDVIIDVRDTRIERNGKFDPADLDDGFDIDEYNDGGILGSMQRTVAIDNYEEGFDFNENNAGDLRVDLAQVQAIGNREEGIDYEEDDDFAGGGDLVATMVDVVANSNCTDDGDGGLKIREKGTGLLTVSLTRVTASNNDASGISIREDAAGTLSSVIQSATAMGNVGHGIDFDENSTGDLAAIVSNSSVLSNGLFGIRADQQTTGAGSLQLTAVTFAGNTGGTTTGNNVVVTTLP